MNLKKIFEVKSNRAHIKITILGVSLSFIKKEMRMYRRQLEQYKKNNVDITKLPKAEGYVRDLQLANLSILKWFDDFCKNNNLEYFLFAGSALGQVRHKGTIPWDDDVDVAMLRDDYNKVLDILREDSDFPFYAELFVIEKTGDSIIKIKHRKSDKFYVDVFALDFTGKNISLEEQKSFTEEIRETRNKIIENKKGSIVDDLLNIRNKYIDFAAERKGSDILLGVEWGHAEPNWFIRYDTVYPIKDVIFEDYTFKSMARPEQYLSDYYGNYMDYPKKMSNGHLMFEKISDKDKEVMEELKGLLK